MTITVEIPDEKAEKLKLRVEQINKNRDTQFTVETFLRKRIGDIVDNQIEMIRS